MIPIEIWKYKIHMSEKYERSVDYSLERDERRRKSILNELSH